MIQQSLSLACGRRSRLSELYLKHYPAAAPELSDRAKRVQKALAPAVPACSECGKPEGTGLIDGLCTPCFCKANPPDPSGAAEAVRNASELFEKSREAPATEVHTEAPEAPGALIPRDTIAQIVAHRDAAVQHYGEFFEALELAHELKKKAEKSIRTCTGSELSAWADGHVTEIETFRKAIEPPDTVTHSRVARRLVDIQFWGHVIKTTDLEVLMDRTAKDELRAQMRYIPEQVRTKGGGIINQAEIDKGLPPVSVEAILETLEKFTEDAGMIWRRGIAKAFAGLDRRFRSHDGFKIGDRIILTNAFNEWGGGWAYGRERDTMIDIERVFLVLDGKKPTASYAGIVGAVDEDRRGFGKSQSCTEGDYFRIRGFLNGNAHLWMTRKDLVEKVNRLLAEYYGAGLGWGKAPREETADDTFAGALMRPVARNYGLFPTPDRVAEKVIEKANLYSRVERDRTDRPLTVIEPSAGTGQLSGRVARYYSELGEYAKRNGAHEHVVDVVEIQTDLAQQLQESGLYRSVMPMDFLKLTVPGEPYDRVIMNPPFDRDRWADHAFHALKFLKPGGRFVAVLPQCAEFSQSRKAKAFRARVIELAVEKPSNWGHGMWTDLDPGSFAESGTYVNTLILAFTRKMK